MVGRIVVSFLVAAAFGACGKVEFSKLGRPCDDGRCANGFECRPDTGLCVPEIARECDGGGVCWSAVTSGDPCDVEGSYVPCSAATDCSDGCRTCRGSQWSSCGFAGCEVGTVDHCAGCGDDCADRVLNAVPACVVSVGGAVCGYTACAGGVDLDGDASNGCECLPDGAESCDGVDNDCDGATDDVDVVVLQNECDALHPNVRVASWRCSGACAIETCEAGWADTDGLVNNGCEDDCVPTSPADEVCDGVDNDCDGARDNVGQVELDAQCGARHTGALAVRAWSCSAAGACVPGCQADNWDANGLPADGCEYACVVDGNERCNGADDDCDGQTDTADSDLDTPSEVNAACAAQHAPATDVTAWACAAGACDITGCAADRWHNDTSLTNGCEYSCVLDGPEVCDGEDDDCDGATDALDPDLDEQLEIDADCSALYSSAVDVDAWSCTTGACEIARCASGTTDASGGVADGCETPCTTSNGGNETCDGEDNDCNGVRDDLDPAVAQSECAARHGGAQAVASWSCADAACAPTCVTDNWDENGLPDDGCEYACVFDGVEVCDGEDDDCDGDTDVADADLDTPAEIAAVCSVQHAPGTDVTEWGCAAGSCEILACTDGTWHNDTDLANGCEYPCVFDGNETCDGEDDDCDGATDTADTDLDEAGEIDGDCAARYSAAQNVTRWFCAGAACGIQECSTDTYHYDDDLTNGCEYGCAQTNGGTEICDNIDNDCDGTTDDALAQCRCADGVNPPAVSETCNDGIDDTCDGVVDGGCPCLGTQTFTVSNATADCRAGASDVPVLHLRFATDCANELQSLVVSRNAQSSLTIDDIGNIRLVDDVDGSGTLSVGDVQLATPSGVTSDEISFAGLTVAVAPGSARTLLLVVDRVSSDGWLALEIASSAAFVLADTNQGKVLQATPLRGGTAALVGARVCDGSGGTPTDPGLGSFAAFSLTQVTAPAASPWAGEDESGWSTGTTYTTGLGDCDLETEAPASLDTRISDLGTASEFLRIDTGVPLGLPLCGLTMRVYATEFRGNQGGRCDNQLLSDLDALWTYAYDGTTTVDATSLVQTAATGAMSGPTSGGCNPPAASEWIDIDLGATYDAAGTVGTLEVRLIAEGDGAIDGSSAEIVNGITEVYLYTTVSP